MRHMWGNDIGRGVTILRTERNQHEQSNQFKDGNFMCGSIKFSQVGDRGGPASDQGGPTNPDPGQSRGLGVRTPDFPTPPLDQRMHLE